MPGPNAPTGTDTEYGTEYGTEFGEHGRHTGNGYSEGER